MILYEPQFASHFPYVDKAYSVFQRATLLVLANVFELTTVVCKSFTIQRPCLYYLLSNFRFELYHERYFVHFNSELSLVSFKIFVKSKMKRNTTFEFKNTKASQVKMYKRMSRKKYHSFFVSQ